MDDKFYDFDSDKAYESNNLKNKTTSSRPARKEFEINIPYHSNISGADSTALQGNKSQGNKSALKSTMNTGTHKKKKLSKGKKFLVVMGIVLTCPSVAALSAFGVVWGWSHFSLPGSEEKNELMDSASKEDVYLDISDDGTSVEVVPMYKDAPSSSSGSSSSKKSETGTTSSSNKANSEKDESDKDGKNEASSDNKDNKDNKDSDASNSGTSSSGSSNNNHSGTSGESHSPSDNTSSSTGNAGSDSESTSGKNDDEIITIE